MAGRLPKYLLLLPLCFLVTVVISAQPVGYYSPADGLSGSALQKALHDIIDNHTVMDYGSLPGYFQTTDKKSDGTVWDMYSDIPGGIPPYIYIFNEDECGNYTKEADCYNREHSFPRSWFNDLPPMYSDLFHIYPTDGWVNGKRGNYPYGITNSPAWTSMNGSKLGPSSYPGYTGTVFEPINSFKGDFARTFFYMAVRYYGEDSVWPGSDMVTGSQPKAWALNMLRDWDLSDPVSQKEKDRNNAVYLLQGNRNPFIDNPAYANLIWGTSSGIGDLVMNKPVRIWPVPAEEFLTIELADQLTGSFNLKIMDLSGKVIKEIISEENPVRLYITDIETGFYILIITSGNEVCTTRIIVLH
jgi:endonuclease I